MRYGEKDGLKNYNLEYPTRDKVGLGLLLLKVEFWAFQYDFSFQFWGVGNNNIYVSRGNIELVSSGGFETVKEALESVINWCEKSNPSVKYPIQISGNHIDLPD